eukprot:Hpha_TRINITY_DN10942_c0_g1::TRINITY_DN10942_c0_g1_i1::g.26709::m.26709
MAAVWTRRKARVTPLSPPSAHPPVCSGFDNLAPGVNAPPCERDEEVGSRRLSPVRRPPSKPRADDQPSQQGMTSPAEGALALEALLSAIERCRALGHTTVPLETMERFAQSASALLMDIAEQQKTAEELAEALASRDQEIANRDKEIASRDQEAERNAGAHAALASELTEMRRALRREKGRVSELESALQEAQQDTVGRIAEESAGAEVARRLEEVESVSQQVQQENDRLQAGLRRAVRRADVAEDECDKAEREVARLHAEVEAAAGRMETLESKLRETEKKTHHQDDMPREVARLHAELEAAAGRIENLESELHETKETAHHQRNMPREVARLNAELEAAAGRMENLESELYETNQMRS